MPHVSFFENLTYSRCCVSSRSRSLFPYRIFRFFFFVFVLVFLSSYYVRSYGLFASTSSVLLLWSPLKGLLSFLPSFYRSYGTSCEIRLENVSLNSCSSSVFVLLLLLALVAGKIPHPSFHLPNFLLPHISTNTVYLSDINRSYLFKKLTRLDAG